MRRVPEALLREFSLSLPAHDRDEMAVPSYLHKNPALRFMAWRRVEVMAKRLAAVCKGMPKAERTIVDYGCGTGVLLGEAAARAERVIGVDLVLSPAQRVLREWNLERVELITPDQALERLPEHGVDVILAAEVLEHVEPLRPTLEFLRTRLKPNGRLLVSLPTETALYRLGRKLAGFSGHYHHENARSVDRVLVDVGFRRLRREFVPLPPPLDIFWVLDYAVA